MTNESLIFAATCDLAGHVRGKAFPSADLESRCDSGVGFTASNIMLSAFGPIYKTPFGTKGDLKLVPDPETLSPVPAEGEAIAQLAMGDILELDGSPWSCCPRSFLKKMLNALEQEFGLRLYSTFEQEFIYTGVEPKAGSSYAFDMLRRSGPFGSMICDNLRKAGIEPDSFLPEGGDQQFELTIKPTEGVTAADQAVLSREIVRATASQLGAKAILTAMMTPTGASSGTHVHFSLRKIDGTPVFYEASDDSGMSDICKAFSAGIIKHMPAITALTAASENSYYRLRPNKWAPTFANLGVQDRASSLRVCPVTAKDEMKAAKQFNLEYRVIDVAASPYMVLGAIVAAGLDGLRSDLSLGNHPQDADADLEAAGIEKLPGSLDEALDLLETSEFAKKALGEELLSAYLILKRSEAEILSGLSEKQVCDRYAEVY
nr:glutamine synthetase family protein [uncultured Cohaesibacter sp.]